MAGRLRSGDETLSADRLAAGIGQLEQVRAPNADEYGALAFLHYAAADNALVRRDRMLWQQELDAAATDATEALVRSPTRADLSLILAEIEFLRKGAGPEVYRALTLSYWTAPRELWIVQRRIGLGLRLIAVAPPDLADAIVGDIHILGEPFRDTERYRILAQAAFVAGPAAVGVVERELGLGHPWPFQLFEQDLAELSSKRRGAAAVQK